MAIPRLKLPLRVERGRYVTVEQGTVDDVANCCEAILRFEQGQLPYLPEFGRPPVAFRQATEPIPAMLRAVLEAWEDRATVLTDDQVTMMDRNIRVIIDA